MSPDPSVGNLADILVSHSSRGVRVQLVLRGLLVVFVALTTGAVPPAEDLAACWAVVISYAALAAATGWLFRPRARPSARAPGWPAWPILFADAAAISALTLLAGITSAQSWTADILINGVFVLPMLAAAQLRVSVCVLVTVPTTAAYLAVSVATQAANAEPMSSILLRTLVLAGLGVGCVALTRVQASRVDMITGLLAERTRLLAEIVGVEARERAAIAEHLHDGALQYLLAARQDLTDARGSGASEAFDRVQYALDESSQSLRATVSELHPAVLAGVGLRRALSELISGMRQRTSLVVDAEMARWPEGSTSSDTLLYSAAREALANVVRHADASRVRVHLELADGDAVLQVADDGRGIGPGVPDAKLADGHIGLASQRARVAAAGGLLTVGPADDGGTLVTVSLPAVGAPSA